MHLFPIQNMGGHLPNPPKNCLRKDMWKISDNVIWLDLSICHTCPNLKICDERAIYLQAVKENGIP